MGYEAIEAFARGLMSALLAQDAKPAHGDPQGSPSNAPPTFVRTEDIDAAVQRYIEAALAQEPPPQGPPPVDAYVPEPPDLGGFVPPEMANLVRENAGDLRTLDDAPRSQDGTGVPGLTRADENLAATYDPNMPGEGTWHTPRS